MSKPRSNYTINADRINIQGTHSGEGGDVHFAAGGNTIKFAEKAEFQKGISNLTIDDNGSPCMAYNSTTDRIEFNKVVDFTGLTTTTDNINFNSNVKVVDGKKLKIEHLYDKDGNKILDIDTNALTFQRPVSFSSALNASEISSANTGYSSVDSELDAIHTSVANNTTRTQNLVGHQGKIIHVGGDNSIQPAGILSSALLTTSANKTITGTLTMNNLTASTFLKLNANKEIVTGDGVDDSTLIKNNAESQAIASDGTTQLTLRVKSDSVHRHPVLELNKQNAAGNSNIYIAKITANEQGNIQFYRGGDEEVRISDGVIDIKNTGGMYKINGSQISSASLSNDSNLAKLDIEPTFTQGINVASGKQYQIDNQQISTNSLSDSNEIAKNTQSNTFTVSNADNLQIVKVKSDAAGDLPVFRLQKRNAADTTTISQLDITEQNFGAIYNDSIQHIFRVNGIEALQIGNQHIRVSKIQFDDGDYASDNVTSPSIEDYQDSLIFNVLAGDRCEFKVNNTTVYQILGDRIEHLKRSEYNSSSDIFHNTHFPTSGTGALSTLKTLSDNESNKATLNTNQAFTGQKNFTTASKVEFAIPMNSIYTGVSALQLSNGQGGSGNTNKAQISFGFNGTNNYDGHKINTVHHNSVLENNRMEFYVSDGSASSSIPTTGTRRAFSLNPTSDGGSKAKVYGLCECDSLNVKYGEAHFEEGVRCDQPTAANQFALRTANLHIDSALGSGVLAVDGLIDYKGYNGAGSFNRLLCGMKLGEDFIDNTKVIKCEFRCYRLGSISSEPERFLTLEEDGGHTNQIVGYGESNMGTVNVTNPASVLKYHSATDLDGTSHNNAAIVFCKWGDYGTDFGSTLVDENTLVVGEGYVFKTATGTNPFQGVTKLAQKTLWVVTQKADDDFRLEINNVVVETYRYASASYRRKLFEIQGDWFHFKATTINGSGGAYCNLIFQCIGAVDYT
jgi:hypothetical protein